MYAVTNVVRRTGETIYTIADDDDHRKIGDVTSDGIFNRRDFHGHVQGRKYETIEDHQVRDAMLDAVAEYVNWADNRRTFDWSDEAIRNLEIALDKARMVKEAGRAQIQGQHRSQEDVKRLRQTIRQGVEAAQVAASALQEVRNQL